MAKQIEEMVGTLFSQMTDEEQLEFIRKVRQSRSTIKVTSRKKQQERKVGYKAKDKIADITKTLSVEDKEKLKRLLKYGL